MKAPSFWWKKGGKPFVFWRFLEKLYALALKARPTPFPKKAACPVISLGNLVVGGAGKTSCTLMLANLLQSQGFAPIIISRGYKRTSKHTFFVDPTQHTLEEAGDEAFVLSQYFPVIVAKKRKDALPLIDIQKNTLILLDDAHQHFSLRKDLSILIWSTLQQLGNGHMIPAGPLREPLAAGLKRTDLFFKILPKAPTALPNTSDPSSLEGMLQKERFSLPIFDVTENILTDLYPQSPILAFCGLGYPQSFLETLIGHSFCVRHFEVFEDHHRYTPQDEKKLLDMALYFQTFLVTTEKDFFKLSKPFQKKVHIVYRKLSLKNPDSFLKHLRPRGIYLNNETEEALP
jgi:tetraacyldisaccharide 4'-kinase